MPSTKFLMSLYVVHTGLEVCTPRTRMLLGVKERGWTEALAARDMGDVILMEKMKRLDVFLAFGLSVSIYLCRNTCMAVTCLYNIEA